MGITALAATLLLPLGPALAFGAALAGDRPTIWDIPLRAAISDIPAANGFEALACGSNGGPPFAKLADWSEFTRCAPEPDQLREVYFRYRDGTNGGPNDRVDPAQIGTTEAFFPVITSVLLDEAGQVQGLRLVTDPRPEPNKRAGMLTVRPRGEHYLLGLYLMERFAMTEADCRDLEPASGETAVVGQFVKRDCAKTDLTRGIRYTISERYLRKRGQTDVDPVSGQLTEGQYESWTRAEVRAVQRSE